MKSWQLNQNDEALIDLALKEDLGEPFCDITTQTLFLNFSDKGDVKIISKHETPIVICGLILIKKIIDRFSENMSVHFHKKDGDITFQGETICTLTGSINTLLMAERTILNFLQRLSAIATKTSHIVILVKDTQLKLLDTRKTTPGLRHLEKYAVMCGGGVNHREGLYDALLIKDNHIDFLGGIKKTLEKIPRDILNSYPVIIEIRTLEELDILLNNSENKITRILFDNMTPEILREAVTMTNKKIATEASGNINENNILEIANTEVDFASLGCLTHSAKMIDLSIKVENLLGKN